MITPKVFYDNSSKFYDSMINFSDSVKTRFRLLQKFADISGENVADIGCGTGIDSIALKQHGKNVTGFDISPEMIAKAKLNASNLKTNIEFFLFPAHEIEKRFNNKFDSIVSLGNAVANIPPGEIFGSLQKMSEILRQNGKLLIQILNYSKILKENERIVNITKSDGYWFVRFYDFTEEGLLFNILRYKESNPKDRELITTTIYPYLSTLFFDFLHELGFSDVAVFGSLTFEAFDYNKSKDLVVLATK